MDGFKSLPKMKCGGSVDKAVKKCGGGYMKKGGKYKEGGDVDLKQDKALIKKAFKQHDEAEHDKEPTEIKLKHGGRAKKDCGSVKKYKAGGAIEMKKSSGDLDTIKKVKATGAKKAAAPSKASERPNLKGSDVEKEKSKPAGEKDLIKKVPPTGDKKAKAPSAGLKGEGNTPKKFKAGGKVKHFVGGGVTGLPTAAPAAVGLAGQGVVSDADRALLQQRMLGQGAVSDNERMLMQKMMQQKAMAAQQGLQTTPSGMPAPVSAPTPQQGPYTQQQIDATIREMARRGMFSHTGD
jgi:hypothetical protein